MRISTTTLESFRLWSMPDQEWMTEADLIATIRGVFVPTIPVLIGRAFGLVLERPAQYARTGGFLCGGYQFDAANLAPALALLDPRIVYEAKGLRTYDTPVGPVDVVAKADGLLGGDLLEFKTTSSRIDAQGHKQPPNTFDAEKYEASCQWRYMVDIFGAIRVTYHVFRLDDHGNSVIELKDVDTLQLYPYPALHADCAALVGRFAQYVEARGLGDLLRSRQRAAA